MADFIHDKLPCPRCGSSDAASVYSDGSVSCHKCGTAYNVEQYKKESGNDHTVGVTGIVDEPEQHGNFDRIVKKGTKIKQFMIPEEWEKPLGAVRQISVDTLNRYGVKYNANGDVFFPYRRGADKVLTGGQVVLDKRVENKKTIRALGDTKATLMFGQHLCRGNGARLIITEGAYDCMSTYDMLGCKYDVVSLTNGTGSAHKNIADNLMFIDGYDEVVLLFDNDQAGKDAIKKVTPLITLGKASIVNIVGYSDPNAMHKAGKIKDFVKMFWNKAVDRPDGIVNLSTMKERMKARTKIKSVPYPWEGVNNMLDGIRKSELVTITSGSGMGKSAMVRELQYHLRNVIPDDEKIGLLSLEEDVERTVDGIIGVHLNKPIHRQKFKDEVPEDEYYQAFDELFETGKYEAYDHFGSTSGDNLLSKCRYMIKALKCTYIFLDHLSIVVSSQEEGTDERKNIDSIMTKLRCLTQETGCAFFLVSHLKRMQGDQGDENGATVSLNHLRGSQSIAQLSDAVIGLERDQQAECPIEANLTRIRVMKSRYTGEVGIATHLHYTAETGRLSEVLNVDEFLGKNEDEESPHTFEDFG